MKLYIFLVIFLLTCIVSNAKKTSILITSEQRQNAVLNSQKYDWAKKMQEEAITKANFWARMSDLELWDIVTDQSITRDIHTNTKIGCPNCGHGIDGYGNYPWEQASEWKLQCPNCCAIYPKNDFKKVLDFINYLKKDDPYLNVDSLIKIIKINEYPNDSLYCDFGYGMLDSSGNKHNIIAYYNHWFVWRGFLKSFQNDFVKYYNQYSTWKGFIIEALLDLSNALSLTNDKKYAVKAGIIIYKIMLVYPSLDYEHQSLNFKKRSLISSNGGKITVRGWENIIIEAIVKSYDMNFDGIVDNLYFIKKIKQLGNIDLVNKNTFDNLFYKNIVSITIDSIKSNLNLRQETNYYLLSLFVIIFKGDTDKETAIKEILFPSKQNGKSISDLLFLCLDRYGCGEATSDYSLITPIYLKGILNLLIKFDFMNKDSIFIKYPKTKQTFFTENNFLVLNSFLPPIGDSYIKDSWRVTYINFRQIDIFSDSLEYQNNNLIKDSVVNLVKNQKINYYVRSDYGQCVLQNELNTTGFGLWIYFGCSTIQSHWDNMNIGLVGYNFDLLPEIGYPDYTGSNQERSGWTSNTFSHNTLLINDIRSKEGCGGIINYIYHADHFQSSQVNSKYAYDNIDLYQRTLFLVEVDSLSTYALDVFRANGGFKHRLSYHSASETVSSSNIKLKKQIIGTFAGDSILFKSLTKNETIRTISGFSFLRDVERTDKYINNNYSSIWKCKDVLNRIDSNMNLYLKIHSLNNLDEVAFATGENSRLRGDILPTFRYMI